MRNAIVGFVVACAYVACGGQLRGPSGASGGAAGAALDGGHAGTPTADAGAPSGSGGASPDSGGAASGGHGGAPAVVGGASGTAGTASSSGAAGTAAGAGGCGTCTVLEQCWNATLCVAASVAVAAGFAIDATEVTRTQYAAWLATKPATTEQGAACSWNSSFEPGAACMAKATVCQGDPCAHHPQVCIDACDAAAYCSAVGKQLCGSIGGGPSTAITDATRSQWQNACTSGGVNRFTYGPTLSRAACNDGTSNFTTTTPVGSNADCHSSVAGYTGIYDLNGNVWEWEDNCTGASGQADICNPRGTGFGPSAALPICDQSMPMARGEVGAQVGFRCCH